MKLDANATFFSGDCRVHVLLRLMRCAVGAFELGLLRMPCERLLNVAETVSLLSFGLIFQATDTAHR